MSAREKLLARCNKRTVQEVDLDGDIFFVRSLTAKALAEYTEVASKDNPGYKEVIALLVKTVCDESGNLLFTESEADLLDGIELQDLLRLADAAQKASGLDKEVEEQSKN